MSAREPGDDARNGRTAGKPHQYKTCVIRMRNLRWAALQVMLGYSPEQLRDLIDRAEDRASPKTLARVLGRPLPTVNKVLQSVRETGE